jgi:hypothetical protein
MMVDLLITEPLLFNSMMIRKITYIPLSSGLNQETEKKICTEIKEHWIEVITIISQYKER